MLQILTDETVSHSYTTMERKVLEAVKGKPATALSRTAHFKSKTRAQTTKRISESDSGSEGTGAKSNVESEAVDKTGIEDMDEDLSASSESDSVGEGN